MIAWICDCNRKTSSIIYHLSIRFAKNKAQLNHNESNSVHEPVIWKSGGAVWALSNLQAVWTACTRKACPKIDSQPSTVFWFKLTYIYIYVFLWGLLAGIYIFALRYHQPSPEISYHLCSEDFLGIPSAIKTNQIRLDPKQMISNPHGLMESDGQEMVLLGLLVRGWKTWHPFLAVTFTRKYVEGGVLSTGNLSFKS